MNATAAKASGPSAATLFLIKSEPAAPAWNLDHDGELFVAAALTIRIGERELQLAAGASIAQAQEAVAGTDYAIVVDADRLAAIPYAEALGQFEIAGGFHFAPGGNAKGRSGGDDVPAINPCSMWDVAWRPSCPDPRGMVCVDGPAGRFWADIYLMGADHLDQGTSAFGVVIADGYSEPMPQNPAGGRFNRFDFAAAAAAAAHHGKGLLSYDEYRAAAYGVTERSEADADPETTGLDAPRTSACGLMQATGNLWVWGHDGDPDAPRASLFGGAWAGDGDGGSRRAAVACSWPAGSVDNCGARARSDHLQLA